jgi:hypothetical protein
VIKSFVRSSPRLSAGARLDSGENRVRRTPGAVGCIHINGTLFEIVYNTIQLDSESDRVFIFACLHGYCMFFPISAAMEKLKHDET